MVATSPLQKWFATMLFLVAVKIFLRVHHILHIKAKNKVLGKRESILRYAKGYAHMAKDPDVSKENREKVATIMRRVVRINNLPIHDKKGEKKVDWWKALRRLNRLEREIGKVCRLMYEETDRAVTERYEVEKLFQKVPNLIIATEGRLALGRTSTQEVQLLDDIKTRFNDAIKQYQSMEPTDLKILLETLRKCMDDLDGVGYMHSQMNRGPKRHYETPDPDVGAPVQQ